MHSDLTSQPVVEPADPKISMINETAEVDKLAEAWLAEHTDISEPEESVVEKYDKTLPKRPLLLTS